MEIQTTLTTEKFSKRLHIETWGCQMNVADSEKMSAILQAGDFLMTSDPADADVIVLNTCHIREKARHKVVSRLGVLKELKKQRPHMTFVLSGCVAQAEGKKLLSELPHLDIVVGPGKIDDLPGLVARHQQQGVQGIALGFHKNKPRDLDQTPEVTKKMANAPLQGKNEVSRYINIQQGCNNYCTFCVVPHTRGREISEHPEQILDRVKIYVQAGAKEVTLLGQNVNSYGLDLVERGLVPASSDGPFVDLLRNVAEVSGLESLRFTTSNPHDFTVPLAKLYREKAVLGEYIHLPVQSGSDRILESMKRKVTFAEYMQRVGWLRESNLEFAISTDLIVGFPGETEADFEETLRLVREVGFSFIFCFAYSPRGKTPAARFVKQVPEEIKSRRLSKLNEVQNAITIDLNQKEIGKERQVLFHYRSKKEDDVFYGRTKHFRLVRVKAKRNLVGLHLPVVINEANKTALVGELI